MLALPLFLTSCDDILGEWSKPTPAVVTPEPEAPVKVTSLTLNKATTWMLIGGSETLNVTTVDPDNATDKSVTWSSDKTSVATVDENTGAINGVAPGTAKITATAKDGSGVTATCTVIVGLLSGKFKINAAGDQIQFAQGNLQATCTSADNDGSTQETWTWNFAANQWTYIDNATANNKINGNGSVSTAGTVDLFGWSTSATHFGIHNSTDDGVYSGDFVDWGSNIGTGWRTLTKDEWTYLLNTRSGSTVHDKNNVRYAKATINTDDGNGGVKGLLLFPDGLTIPSSAAHQWATDLNNDWNGWTTLCTIDEWNDLADMGCVFLPGAGWREGTTVKNLLEANPAYVRYWSSTPDGGGSAFFVNFKNDAAGAASQFGRNKGLSVRLVYPAQ